MIRILQLHFIYLSVVCNPTTKAVKYQLYNKMKKNLKIIIFLFTLFVLNSCSVATPFFIQNTTQNNIKLKINTIFSSKFSGADSVLIFDVNNDRIEKKNIPSYFWMFITSNYFFILIFSILIFLPLFGKQQRTLKSLSGWFAGLVSFSLIMIIVTWIAFKIPIIDNNPIYNYILNVIIHTFFIVIIVKNSDKELN